ncbi:MAG: hypothetical protein CME34_04975 [Gordonia sp.]|uniref:hypothetical protein n=1 Tax=Gordonia sp. (in: high G+C Gram-positive bacteria) TaxID=84139 RepID=UPI000C4AEA98|nr:hypothetical protein [Gordonia sp. (in: high G+C Gram-positive bacteria)]MAU81218.1 hypothetical protein [Gordonia sp. (in: high G+C Gram-positive bacteria)]
MDVGRKWALETFGKYGPLVRGQIAELVKKEHEASADAQEASGHRSHGVYGEFWRGILEKFEAFGSLPGAALVRPANAPYKIPVVNGVALFPWRYAKTRDSDMATTLFGTSDTRVEIANLRPPAVQGEFEFDLPDPGIDDEERQLLLTLQSAVEDPVVTSGRLVLVAVASSVRGLFAVEWGEVELDSTGFVRWTGFQESLLSVVPTAPASTSPTRTFTTGDIPRKFPKTEVDRSSDG